MWILSFQLKGSLSDKTYFWLLKMLCNTFLNSFCAQVQVNVGSMLLLMCIHVCYWATVRSLVLSLLHTFWTTVCQIQYLLSYWLHTYWAMPHIPACLSMPHTYWTSPHTIEEEKAKVNASVWGEEFIQFLAALAILPRTILKNRIN